MFLDNLNSNKKQISNLIKKEHIFVLTAVSDKKFLYLPTLNKFIIWDKIIDFLPSIIKDNKIIIVNNLKNISKYINLIWVFEKFKCWDNIIDINGLYYSKYNKPLKSNILKEYNNSYQSAWKKYRNFLNSRYNNKNIDIPLPILSDWYYEKFKVYDKIFNETRQFQNSGEYKAYILRSIVFYQLERNGLRIDSDKIKSFSGINNKLNSLKNKTIIHPEAKVNASVTGRVSYGYKKINFMALDKESKINNVIISRFGKNGKLYNFDYDAFHPRIIFQLLNQPIPLDKKGHEYIAEKYFDIKNKSHSEIKQKIFQILYGEYNDNNEFSELMKYFKRRVDIYKTPLGRTVGKVKERKKPNYFIQKYEADLMTMAMSEIIKLLKDYKSKICLYQYDSLIIDIFNKEKSVIEKIVNIMETINNMTFKVKIKNGNNLYEIRS